jgi:prolipoprotein diacylglyceryl transferase
MKAIFIREKEPLEKMDKLLMYMIVSTLAGARLGHVLFYQRELFFEDPLSVFLPFKFVPEFQFSGFTGLASHGATIGIAIALFYYAKKVDKRSSAWIFDRIVIPISFGAIFVRLGNFMNSEIVGKATNSDFGVIFVQNGENFPRHPAQLYESAAYLLLFLLLYYLYWKTPIRKKSGMLFGLFFSILWAIRFFVEFFKKAQLEEREDWFLNTGQILSIPMFLVGLVVIFLSLRNYKKNAES